MEVKFLNASYRYPHQSDNALMDITTTIGPGTHLLLGENGAGKTTLLHLIAGLLFPTAGECRIDGGRTCFRLPSVTTHVSFLGENSHFPAKSINEMSKIHARFYPSFSKELLKTNLDRFSMTGNESLVEMSLGSRKKAMLAYVLSLGTEITLLDEPANGLDIESKAELQKMIVENSDEEKTLILSTHTFSDFQKLFDSIIVLHKGCLQISANIESILERIAFSLSTTPDPDSIYSESRMGGFISIVPNDNENMESDIDFGVLYNALRNENSSNNLINLITPTR